jgi:hypothetical protein
VQLRLGLEHTGLLQVEPVPGVNFPFRRFHPTLAPALWERLTPTKQANLAGYHWKVYYKLSSFLPCEKSEDIQVTRHCLAGVSQPARGGVRDIGGRRELGSGFR